MEGHMSCSADADSLQSSSDPNLSVANSQATSLVTSYTTHAAAHEDLDDGIAPETEEDSSSNMTTYYVYHADGSVIAFPPGHSTAAVPPAESSYWRQVMAWKDFHSRRGRALLADYYANAGRLSAKYPDSVQISHSFQHSMSDVQPSSNTSIYSPLQSGHGTPRYLDLETIRDHLDLHSLLSYVDHIRLNRSLRGPVLDIFEEGTKAVFAFRVPKKMLVLFCGRHNVIRFMRTLSRQDNENWAGLPTQQCLVIPRERATAIGFKLLINWMKMACYAENCGKARPIRVPKNLFAAISLARVMGLLGLHRDVYRAEGIIGNIHFERPLWADEVKSVWKGCPKDSKYTERMISVLRDRLSLESVQRKKVFPDLAEVEDFLREAPVLYARIYGLPIQHQTDGTFTCKENTSPNDKEQRLIGESKVRSRKIENIKVLKIRSASESGTATIRYDSSKVERSRCADS